MNDMEHLGRLVERTATSYFGKYRGQVTDVDDPLGQGRIRATVPAVMHEHECDWALPAVPFAGAQHGMLMLPAIGAGVWIEFEAGNINTPIWSGTWWAEHEKPDDAEAQVRVIVSENGHKVVLNDKNDELTLTHGSGPEIKLTATEIILSCGQCELRISGDNISLNNGVIKVGIAGVSLVNGAMAFGVPP
ncbi:hypothetical protein F2P44_16165 [Massilia sp. CCM 8695]|uniref:Gp5/Type VI secretion system Vgr protein OB-fold domain-containing protein n=1 Tax=Massilia frigida TaxID=2609281 RepID=A0ABX0NE41_9BURK|nr:phage baseplate assembly protein V [Massilia frigida]NHZ80796.1 hypothetical protein [Massilia frigida]